VGKKSGPKPPDPVALANAQGEANTKTALEQQKLNMVSTQGPYGSVRYEADPTSPGGYKQVTALSPEEQAIYSLSNSADQGALRLANDQIGRIGQALGRGFDLGGLPGVASGGVVNQFDKGQALKYAFDPGQAVQGQVGGDLEAARKSAVDAVYGQATSRLDPRFERQEQSLDVKLANQGLSENSAAAQNARDAFGRERTDAYNQAQYAAINAGEQAAQGQFGRQLSQGQFANEAAAQMYGQNMGQAGFHNQTAGQDYGQNLGEAEFKNQAQAQSFDQSMRERQQKMQEMAYEQNLPINQFATLMGSGQVSMPEGIGYSPTQVGQTDVLGAHALSNQVAQANAQRKAGMFGGAMSGLFGLGSAALMGSDVRLKEDIVRVGEHPLGIGVYDFRYRGRPERFRGVIAQELETVRPDLVFVGSDGMRAVNYAHAALRGAA
jgi:hypothetical protein